MRTKLGVTLIELMVTIAVTAMIVIALSRAFYVVVHYEINAPQEQQTLLNKLRFEDRMRALLQAAWISASATDQTSYFIGTVQGQNPNGQPNLTDAEATPGTAAATAPVAATTDAQSAISNGSSDGIVFTAMGERITPTYLNATGVSLTDDGNGGNNSGPSGGSQNFQPQGSGPNGQDVVSDLETLNQTYGAVGGVQEIAISGTAVGNPGQSSGDIYIRRQVPADADYTQGGNEEVFDSNVSKMQFEFYDGLQWDGGWDTTSNGGHYLPSAVRIHYWMKDDPNTEDIFVVQIPLSVLTPAQPLSTLDTTTTTNTTTTTTTVGGGGGTGGRGGGGTGGGAGGGTGGRGGAAPLIPVLPGVLPQFSNLQVVPEVPVYQPVPLDPRNLLAPNSLSADDSTSDRVLVPQFPTPPWQRPPEEFSFYPRQDPLLPPQATSNANASVAKSNLNSGPGSKANPTNRTALATSKEGPQ